MEESVSGCVSGTDENTSSEDAAVWDPVASTNSNYNQEEEENCFTEVQSFNSLLDDADVEKLSSSTLESRHRGKGKHRVKKEKDKDVLLREHGKTLVNSVHMLERLVEQHCKEEENLRQKHEDAIARLHTDYWNNIAYLQGELSRCHCNRGQTKLMSESSHSLDGIEYELQRQLELGIKMDSTMIEYIDQKEISSLPSNVTVGTLTQPDCLGLPVGTMLNSQKHWPSMLPYDAQSADNFQSNAQVLPKDSSTSLHNTREQAVPANLTAPPDNVSSVEKPVKKKKKLDVTATRQKKTSKKTKEAKRKRNVPLEMLKAASEKPLSEPKCPIDKYDTNMKLCIALGVIEQCMAVLREDLHSEPTGEGSINLGMNESTLNIVKDQVSQLLMTLHKFGQKLDLREYKKYSDDSLNQLVEILRQVNKDLGTNYRSREVTIEEENEVLKARNATLSNVAKQETVSMAEMYGAVGKTRQENEDLKAKVSMEQEKCKTFERENKYLKIKLRALEYSKGETGQHKDSPRPSENFPSKEVDHFVSTTNIMPILRRIQSVNEVLKQNIRSNNYTLKVILDLVEDRTRLRSKLTRLNQCFDKPVSNISLDSPSSTSVVWSGTGDGLSVPQSSCNSCMSLLQDNTTDTKGLLVSSSAIQFLYKKCHQREMFRRNLVRQKKYLLCLLNDFQDTQRDTLKHMARLLGRNSCQILKIPKKRVSFRSVVLVVIAVGRFQRQHKRWRLSRSIRSTTLEQLCTSSQGIPAHVPEAFLAGIVTSILSTHTDLPNLWKELRTNDTSAQLPGRNESPKRTTNNKRKKATGKPRWRC